MSNAVTEAGEKLIEYTDFTGGALSINISPDGDKAVLCTWDDKVYIFDTNTGEKLLTYSEHTSEVHDATFNPAGDKVASCSWDYTAHIFDVDTGDKLLEYEEAYDSEAIAIDWSPNGDWIVVGFNSGEAHIVDAETGDNLLEYTEHTNMVSSACFSPDNSKVVTGSTDSTAHIFDVDTGDKLLEYEGHTDDVNDVVFHPNKEIIITGSDDNTSHIVDAETGDKLLEYNIGSNVQTVDISPDGKRAVIGTEVDGVHVFEISTGEKIFEHNPYDDSVNEVSFSEDGNKMLLADSDHILISPLVDWYLNILDKRGNISLGFEGVALGDSTHKELSLDLGDIKLEDESDIIPLGFVNLTHATIKNIEITSSNIDSGITFTKSKEEDSFEDEDSLTFDGPYEHEEGDDFYVLLDTDATAPTGDGTLDLTIEAEF